MLGSASYYCGTSNLNVLRLMNVQIETSLESTKVSRPSESCSATISSPPGERVSQEIMSPEQVEARYDRSGQAEALLLRN
jgi:hypothetical protein